MSAAIQHLSPTRATLYREPAPYGHLPHHFMLDAPSRSVWSTNLLLALALALGCSQALAQRPLGTDVSGYQPSINWTTVKNAGVAFAWAKATEGTGYVNPYFTAQEAGAKSVGIYIGAYHYARPGKHPNITGANSADSEAAYFWSTAGAYVKYGGAYLVPMLDWEDIDVTNQLSAATMSAWVNEWCLSVSNTAAANGVFGVRPLVYTGAWYSRPSSTYSGLTTAVTNWQCAISGYPSNPNPQTGAPSDTYPWPTFNIWQYADTNWSGGDADVYNGTLTKFVQTFVVGGTNAPSFTTSPTNIDVALGASATFYSKVSGLAPLTFRWLFNGAAIPGATSSNYTVVSAQLANAGAYTLMASNSYANVSASPAFLSVEAPLTNSTGSVLAPTGMVDWWSADGNLTDIYGGKNATPQNGFSYATGKQGLAWHFNGSTSYLTTGAATIAVPWTACFWVNRQNAPGSAAALTGDGVSYELKLEQYNVTRQVGFTRFGVADYNFGYTVPLNTWTHLAFVASGTQMQLYANGALVSTLSTNIPLPRAYIGAGYLASGGGVLDYMSGSLDEVMMFNRALTSTEISGLYAAGSAGLVRAPQFTGTGTRSGNLFPLNIKGLTGKSLSIYRSTDLLAWTRIATSVADSTGTLQWTDTTATNAQSFYRVSQP
jgi:GH25 family lysozyme M1 (1,4-beta-N-acetylmuramidase)